MSTALREPWTVERFLAWEDKQEGKHEFDGRRIIAITGESRAHQIIVHNLQRLLEDLLDLERFEVLAEMRLAYGGWVRYPDVLVCPGPLPDATRTLRDAVVAFEVLSGDTARTDRETKRLEYAAVPSLRRYILIEQTRRAALVLERAAEGWVEMPVVAGAIPLPELGIELPLEAIYRRVRFA